MLTPVDINNKEFKRAFRGYDIDEVEEFLEMICEDYEKLYKENATLKEKLEISNEKLEHYSEIEATIQNTLILAQNAAEQAKKSALKEADLIVKNANENAKKIIDKANNDVIKINDDYDRIKQEFIRFTNKFRNFMNSQLEMFKSLEDDFLKSYNIGKTTEKIKEKDIESSTKEKEIDKNLSLNQINNSNINQVETLDLDKVKSFFAEDKK